MKFEEGDVIRNIHTHEHYLVELVERVESADRTYRVVQAVSVERETPRTTRFNQDFYEHWQTMPLGESE